MSSETLLILACILGFCGMMLVLMYTLCKAAALGDAMLERERLLMCSPRSNIHVYLTGGE